MYIMKKKIAIPTQNGKLSNEITESTVFNLFELENNNVVGVEHKKLKSSSANHTFLWLIAQSVTDLYIGEISKELKTKLTSFGIIVKTANELSENSFFNRFVFE